MDDMLPSGTMKTLLIVYHSMTGGTRQMAEAAAGGPASESTVRVRLLPAPVAQASDLLEADGYIVEEAVNGRQALALYRKHPADLIITDIAMPEMNGLELLTELTAKYANIKVIAMSGLDENLAVATLLGACETVLKPFNLDELERMVSTHLAHTGAV